MQTLSQKASDMHVASAVSSLISIHCSICFPFHLADFRRCDPNHVLHVYLFRKLLAMYDYKTFVDFTPMFCSIRKTCNMVLTL